MRKSVFYAGPWFYAHISANYYTEFQRTIKQKILTEANMKPTMIIVTGEHILLRTILQEYVVSHGNIVYFPSLENNTQQTAHSLRSYFEERLEYEIKEDDNITKVIEGGHSVIIEQWHLDLLTKIRLINDSRLKNLEKLIIRQFMVFDKISKRVFYVSKDIEKLNEESDFQNSRSRLLVLSVILRDLNLPVENIDGEDSFDRIKERTLYLLQED